MKTNQNRKMRGFSFVELLLVFTILSILAAIAINTLGKKKPDAPFVKIDYGYVWQYARSPLTGKCYEIATDGYRMGMSEIPCQEAKFTDKN